MPPQAASRRPAAWLSLLLALSCLLPSAGCPMLLASGVYFWEGGNMVDADYDGLKQQRVVVFCRPPSSSTFSHAGAARDIAKRVSSMLEQNVPKIDIVHPQEVDQWIDENDSDDYKALGKAVDADRVVHVELDHFELFSGKTLYQGVSEVSVTVYDMRDNGRRLWDREMGEFIFPEHGGVPVQDRSVQDFQRQYVEILSGAIARHFYKHDPHAGFATDALSIR
ncbi:hypothetical protein Pla123a_20300 [Posidoniimonas polymericola]|uniref:Uncharacterized protein n=1 Tax=Posidoniimonas polymericola TaxID=2528002 RepID=A0A5C5YR76_9BACT|nr:hypothetical protein [Posidoniimonas polymericola]TWT77369.1 hypothetical protein Pla123a_20300 [Posidoniimonas polymericola]